MSDLTQPPDEFDSESAHTPKRGRTTPPIPEKLRNWFVLPADEEEERAEHMDARPDGDESDAGLYPAAGMTEIDGQVIGRSHVVHRPTPAQPTREPAHNAYPRPSTSPAHSPAHSPAQLSSMGADERDTDGSDADGAEAHGSATIPSYIDTVVVASLADRTVSVNPGASLSLWVNVLNNGPLPALFRVHVEGWIEAEWVAVHPLHQAVPPGERATMRIDIAPPRAPGSRAGARQLVIVVQAAEYPGRQSRLVATLTINGYDDIILDDFQPRRVETSWGRRTAALLVPVRNQGNRATAVRISGQCSSTPCRFGFKIGANEHRREESAIFTVEPGQTVPVRVRVRPDRMPIF
ncbi:MAG: hypothetical protein KDD78_19985, partial [Caldilineaceae bacterium]|nr:hypothetical protein [Caldilineaceae bacterium]